MKKLIAIFMVISLIFPSCIAIAETAKGKTIKLESYSGTVTVLSGTGKEISVTEKMRVFDGYKVKTGNASNVYLSLDNTKVVKLDQNTEVSIKKSWFSNKVVVISGALFFNVTAPLKDNESLDLVTSTMSMGIRGTSGTLQISNGVSIGQIYTGKIEARGKKKQVKVNAGEQVISENMGEDENKLEVLKLSSDGSGIPSFGLEEINKDSNLKNEIKDQTELDTDNFEEQENINKEKENEELLNKQKEQEIKEQEAKKNKLENKKSSTDNSSITGKSSGGGGGSSKPSLSWEELLSWLENNPVELITDVTDYMQNYSTPLNSSDYSRIGNVIRERVLREEIMYGIMTEYECIESPYGYIYDYVESTGSMENFTRIINDKIELIRNSIGCYLMNEEIFVFITEINQEIPNGVGSIYIWGDMEISEDLDLSQLNICICDANITINSGVTLDVSGAYIEVSGNSRIYNNGTINAFDNGVTVYLNNPITAYRFIQGTCSGGLTVWLDDIQVWCQASEDGIITVRELGG